MKEYTLADVPQTFFHIKEPDDGGERVTVVSHLDTERTVDRAALIPLVDGGPNLRVDTPQAFTQGGRLIIATFDGPCVSCNRRCYSLNSGDNDGLRDNGDSGLDARDYDMVGPHVPLCVVCANIAERQDAAVATAKLTLWKEKPPTIKFDLSAFAVPAEAFWEQARFGDGYDRMDAAASRGWLAVSSWGQRGWDFLEWPYYIGYVRNTSQGFEFATNCEGDVNVYRFPTLLERQEAMDKLAFWHWQVKGESWVEGIHPDEIPPHLKGPYLPE